MSWGIVLKISILPRASDLRKKVPRNGQPEIYIHGLVARVQSLHFLNTTQCQDGNITSCMVKEKEPLVLPNGMLLKSL